MNSEILAFFDLLKKPLSKEELDFYSSKKFKKNSKGFEKILYKGKEYFSSLDKYDARESLNEHSSISKEYLQRVNRFSKWMRLVPFVKCTCICNNLAFSACDKGSDIDLFVITSKNRMFIARAILTFLLHFLGVRRHGNKVEGRFCLSFFISEDGMDFESIRLKPFDVYLLFWMRSLRPLFGKGLFEKFVDSNEWFKEYFPETDKLNYKYLKNSKNSIFARFLEFFLKGKVGNFLESKLEKWQLSRALEKKSQLKDASGTVISKTMLKFHDNDKREEFLNAWQSLLKN